MKQNLLLTLLLAALLLPAMTYITSATGPDTIWTRNSQNGLDGILEENFEFHPTNDSIFIFTGRTYSNNVLIDSSTVHFVNTITGQTFLKYAPIRMAHYTPDGNFLIGHNDSTIAYISLDSMKPVRSYPIMKNALGNFTIDERGKYVYTTGFTDTNKKFGFFRWSIDSGTVEQINLPDSLFRHPDYNCPTKYAAIREMYASDTAKILLLEIEVNRPEPFCPVETRIWGIDLNADTVKYDFLKLDPTIRSSYLDNIFPKAVRFIGSGWRYDPNTGKNKSFMNVYDVATGDSLEKMHGIFASDYTFSKYETYLISSGAGDSYDKMIVYNFNNRDTVFIYDGMRGGPIVISPNNEFILMDYTVKFVLFPTPWYPTSIAEPRDDTPQSLIYPNPGTDEVRIDIPPLERGSGGVSVFDVFGKKYMDSRLRGNDILVSSEGNVRIDISSLSPGVYFVQVGDKMFKFVKM